MRRALAFIAAAAILVACKQTPSQNVHVTVPIPVSTATATPRATTAPATAEPAVVPTPTETPESTPTPKYTPNLNDPPPSGNGPGPCVIGDGGGQISIGSAGCGPTPTPVPTTSATPPPLRDHQAWIGEDGNGIYTMHDASTTDMLKFADLCEGFLAPNTGIYPNSCPGPLNPDGSHRWGYTSGYILYMEAGMGQPNLSGHDVDFPFGSGTYRLGHTCNAAAQQSAGDFWNQQTTVTLNGTSYTIPDYTSTGSNNWFVYASGGTIGNVNYMVAGNYGSQSTYYFYLNLNSASLLAYANDVIANCAYNTTYRNAGVPFDAAEIMHDNVLIGLESAGWTKYDRYSNGKNIGTSATGTYADPTKGAVGNAFTPSSFFSGSYQSRTNTITSSDATITYPGNSYGAAQIAFLGGLKHYNGNPVLVEYNGYLNTDNDLNKQSNTRFALAEESLVGCFSTCPTPQPLPYNGPTEAQIKSGLGTDAGMRMTFNEAAALYQEVVKPGINTKISFINLADQPAYLVNATSTTALGTGLHQQNLMWDYAPIISMFSDDAPYMMSAFNDQCGLGSTTALRGSNCMDTWPFDFAMPSGRITPMPADPTGAASAQPCSENYLSYMGTGLACSIGGAYDANILAGGIAGLYATEFAHFWVFQVTGTGSCTGYDQRQWSNCAVDIGPLFILINASGSAKTISAANLALWAPHIGSQLNHVFVPCTPTVAYWGSGAGAAIYAMPQSGSLGYGTGSVCSGTTGDDLPSGGTWDNSKALSDITSNSQVLYDGQVLYLTK